MYMYTHMVFEPEMLPMGLCFECLFPQWWPYFGRLWDL